jgi:hypothetical protein
LEASPCSPCDMRRSWQRLAMVAAVWRCHGAGGWSATRLGAPPPVERECSEPHGVSEAAKTLLGVGALTEREAAWGAGVDLGERRRRQHTHHRAATRQQVCGGCCHGQVQENQRQQKPRPPRSTRAPSSLLLCALSVKVTRQALPAHMYPDVLKEAISPPLHPPHLYCVTPTTERGGAGDGHAHRSTPARCSSVTGACTSAGCVPIALKDPVETPIEPPIEPQRTATETQYVS